MAAPLQMGTLQIEGVKGREVFSFEYLGEWLRSGFAQEIDPDLQLYAGPQYLREGFFAGPLGQDAHGQA